MARLACVLSLPPVRLEIQSALEELIKSVSPFFEIDGPCFFFSVSPQVDEEEFSAAFWKAAQALSSCVQLGIARTKTIARWAAWKAIDRPRHIEDASESQFLSTLPLAALKPSPEAAHSLRTWGVNTLGDLLRLPPKKLTTLLGREGWTLYQRAQGIDPSPLRPVREPMMFSESLTLEWSVSLIQPCVSFLERALDRLSHQLTDEGLACEAMELTLTLDPKGKETRHLRLRSPTNEVKTLLRLLELDLSASPPSAPFNGFHLRAHPAAPVLAQLSLFGATTLSPSKIATSLAEFETLMGSDRVGSPQTTDDYAPERWAMQPYAPPPTPLIKTQPHELRALLAVRVLRPAVSVHVQTKDDMPFSVFDTRSSWKIKGTVDRSSGPWPLDSHWWDSSAYSRNYWDVLLSDGALYRLFEDQQTKSWYADGIYD